MTTATQAQKATATTPRHGKGVRFFAVVAMIIGALFVVAGAGAWFVVSSQLASENITVSEDAPFLAGALVQDPLTAFAQAQVINQHALEMTDGKTFADLDRNDPERETLQTASFLRASLFTSVVSFGVALFAVGAGVVTVVFAAIAIALSRRHVTAAG